MNAPLVAPTWSQTIARESTGGRELIRLPLRSAALARAPRGDGRPVVLVPGLGATDASLAPLRRYLVRLGHDARTADLGRIRLDVAATVPRLVAHLRRIRAETGEPVALVGQSLGGVLSRQAARREPGLVRRIVTFGTPVIGGRSVPPVGVPVTAMWSRNDGIVTGAACVDPRGDRPGTDVENVEVSSSHLGMGLDPDVWLTVADRLVQP